MALERRVDDLALIVVPRSGPTMMVFFVQIQYYFNNMKLYIPAYFYLSFLTKSPVFQSTL